MGDARAWAVEFHAPWMGLGNGGGWRRADDRVAESGAWEWQRAELGRERGIGRQSEILQYHRWLEAPCERERFGARRGHQYFVFVEAPFELPLQAFIVFDDQEFWFFFGHIGSLIQNLVPRPGALHTSISPPIARAYSRTW